MMERIFVGRAVQITVKGVPTFATLAVSKTGALVMNTGGRNLAISAAQIPAVLGQVARGGPAAAEMATAILVRTGEPMAPNYYRMALTAINTAMGGGEPDPALAAELSV
jgi:hypothetical protein